MNTNPSMLLFLFILIKFYSVSYNKQKGKNLFPNESTIVCPIMYSFKGKPQSCGTIIHANNNLTTEFNFGVPEQKTTGFKHHKIFLLPLCSHQPRTRTRNKSFTC